MLIAALIALQEGTASVTTGDVYAAYHGSACVPNLDVLTQRRVTDLISELDMLGVIEARVMSKGGNGRTNRSR